MNLSNRVFLIIMRCIVIDDEKPAVDLICDYIGKVPFLELAGTFTELGAAVPFVMSEPVDLVFSDIELNSVINGIQFIKSLPNPPMVIFISAFDRYAVDSYTIDAVDYLMKPVSKERFFSAVNKAYRLFNMNRPADAGSYGEEHNSQESSAVRSDFVFIKTENRFVKIFYSEILFIKGYGDYIKIYLTGDRTLLSLQSLNRLEAILPDSNFIRVHRSFIIAMDKISEIERKRIMIGNEIIPVGESYQSRFFSKVLPPEQ